MYLCPPCFLLGYCKTLTSVVVTNKELKRAAFILDLKRHLRSYGLGPKGLRNAFYQWYADYPGRFISAIGLDVELDLGPFEERGFCDWLKEFMRISPGVEHRVRIEAVARVRLIATIIRAVDPSARLWGLEAANNNDPATAMKGRASFDLGCPYSPDRAGRLRAGTLISYSYKNNHPRRVS